MKKHLIHVEENRRLRRIHIQTRRKEGRPYQASYWRYHKFMEERAQKLAENKQKKDWERHRTLLMVTRLFWEMLETN